MAFCLVTFIVIKVRTIGKRDRETTPIYKSVSFQLPIYNEPPSMIRKILESISNQNYPKELIEVLIIDQSDRKDIVEELKRLVNCFKEKRDLDVKLFFKDRFGDGKTSSSQFKAGAMNYATKRSSNELICVLDGDNYIEKNFLAKSVPHFRNEKVGIVIGRQVFTGNDLISRYFRVSYNATFLISVFRTALNFPIFITGSGVLLRKSIPEKLQWDTISEDVHMSIYARLNGWQIRCEKNAIAYNDGAPGSFRSYKRAMRRIGYGQGNAVKNILTDKEYRSKALTDLRLLIVISPVFMIFILVISLPINLLLFSINVNDNSAFIMITMLVVLGGAFLFTMAIISSLMFGQKTDILFYPLVIISSTLVIAPIMIGLLRSFFNKDEDFYRTQRAGEKTPIYERDVLLMELIIIVFTSLFIGFFMILGNSAGAGFFFVFLVSILIGMINFKRKTKVEINTWSFR
jgi:cellulose synthase/poly-beta-1,6-N-acetylglucosamine synthase-like glycosyltransferase